MVNGDDDTFITGDFNTLSVRTITFVPSIKILHKYLCPSDYNLLLFRSGFIHPSNKLFYTSIKRENVISLETDILDVHRISSLSFSGKRIYRPICSDLSWSKSLILSLTKRTLVDTTNPPRSPPCQDEIRRPSPISVTSPGYPSFVQIQTGSVHLIVKQTGYLFLLNRLVNTPVFTFKPPRHRPEQDSFVPR